MKGPAGGPDPVFKSHNELLLNSEIMKTPDVYGNLVSSFVSKH